MVIVIRVVVVSLMMMMKMVCVCVCVCECVCECVCFFVVVIVHWHCSVQLSMFNMEKCYRNKIIIIIIIINDMAQVNFFNTSPEDHWCEQASFLVDKWSWNSIGS